MHVVDFLVWRLIYLTFLDICLIQGGTADEQQLEQLKILYKARGSKVEDLVNEMDLLKQGMGREIRILKHQLSMAKGEIYMYMPSHEKTSNVGSDQVRHKPTCAVTEAG